MEKVGGMVGSDKLQERGAEKREQAGARGDYGIGGDNNYKGSSDNY